MLTCKSLAVLGLVATMALVGCGGPGGELKLGEVKGTVLLDGQPLTKGAVSFIPDKSKGTTGPLSTGSLNEKGQFTLTAAGGKSGAVVGGHKVTVSSGFDQSVGSSASGVAAPKEGGVVIPKKYGDYATTDLTADVKAGPNEVKLELKSR